MRAHEVLFEDNRSKIDKLRSLIDHPATEDNIRSVAQGRLEILMASECPEIALSRLHTPTNITEEDLDRPFVRGVNMGQIYDNLRSLSPAPNHIDFLRQGVIRMIVPPPFMGKTRAQYIEEVHRACPGCLDIKGHMIEGQGYLFSISYI